MRTRVRVTNSVLLRAPPWQLRQGKRRPTHKRLNPTAANLNVPPGRLSLVAAAVKTAAAAVSRGVVPFHSLVAGNNLNLGERWGRGCLQDRWAKCRTVWTLATGSAWAENLLENKLISHCKGGRSCSCEEPEDWIEWFSWQQLESW